jgi:SET domain-containing protein
MLVVPTYVDVSPKRGLGLFAKENISKGDKYWVRNEIFDKIISPTEFRAFSNKEADDINIYGCLETSQNWYLCNDNSKYTNHSAFPNSKAVFNNKGLIQFLIASKDIDAGEEIFCNYMELCLTCKAGVSFTVVERVNLKKRLLQA